MTNTYAFLKPFLRAAVTLASLGTAALTSTHLQAQTTAPATASTTAKVNYARLVEYFWRTIDPTVKDQQFFDHGSPYRTAIFAQDAQQLKIAQDSRAALDKTKPFKEPIVTEIVLASTFYPAEEYHQNYYQKNPLRYKYYRTSCGRDARLKQLWGSQAAH
jgi:peptide-methionine (S)-S-oxide reductase